MKQVTKFAGLLSLWAVLGLSGPLAFAGDAGTDSATKCECKDCKECKCAKSGNCKKEGCTCKSGKCSECKSCHKKAGEKS